MRYGAGGKWSVYAARMSTGLLKHRRRILLGKRVADAHHVPFVPFKTFTPYEINTDGMPKVLIVLVLPHPSGRNLIWNDPRMKTRARQAVARFMR